MNTTTTLLNAFFRRFSQRGPAAAKSEFTAEARRRGEEDRMRRIPLAFCRFCEFCQSIVILSKLGGGKSFAENARIAEIAVQKACPAICEISEICGCSPAGGPAPGS
jgi:hypothetical protein